MRRSTRVVASLLGIFAGFGGPEHGYFELLQGNVRPDSLMFASTGPPCDPDMVWHACEPAMTIIPNFLVTGILAIVIGLLTMIWSGTFIHTKYGGMILILLAIALLLVGGGIVPPVIGIVAGAVATKINKPLAGRPGRVLSFLARLWPWPLVGFFVWAFGQFVVGYFFNDLLTQSGFLSLLLILGLLILSIATARAHDAREAARSVV